MIAGLLQRAGLESFWPKTARRARSHAIVAAIVLWVGLIITFIAGAGDRSIAGPIKGTDFLQFYTMGSLVTSGHLASLYDFEAFHQAQVSVVPESAPEIYPPVYPPQTALLFAPFSHLGFRQAMLLWTFVTVVVFAVIAYSAWRSVSTQFPDRVFVISAAASFPPFWHLVLYGQATIVIVAAFWLGWLALERRRPFLGGLAFGLLLFKPQFGIPLVVICVVCREWSLLMGSLVCAAVQLCAITSTLGVDVLRAYVGFIPTMVRHADLLEPKPFQSHSLRAITRLLAPTWIGLTVWSIMSIVIVALAVHVWKSAAPVRVRVGIVILASVLVNPHVIIYDATVVALPVIWFGGYVQEHWPAMDVKRFWICVYWLFVTFLIPTAALIGVQISVLLMIWLFVRVARTLEPTAGRTFAPGRFSEIAILKTRLSGAP